MNTMHHMPPQPRPSPSFTTLLFLTGFLSLLLLLTTTTTAHGQTLANIRPAGYYTAEKMKEIRKTVVEHFYHAYDGYMKNAFPADQLKPLSCSADDSFGRYSVTAVDALDTLALIGDYKEFFRLVDHIDEKVHFDADMTVSVFETTIRVIGGLTTAHDIAIKIANAVEDITQNPAMAAAKYDNEQVQALLKVSEAARRYDGVLLRKAVLVADKIVHAGAFDTPTGIPYNEINFRRGIPREKGHSNCPAGGGSLLVEMAYLSHLSGNCTFLNLARQAFMAIWKHRSPHNQVGSMQDIYSGYWQNTESNIGASIDSFFEYASKTYVVSGDPWFADMWEQASRAVYLHQQFSGWFLSSSVEFRGPLENFEHRFNSLQTFWPGLQALSGDVQGAMYSFEKTHCVCRSLGFPPEYLHVGDYVTSSPNPRKSGPGYPLRPEVIESAYYLYTATHDDYFLNVGEHFLTYLQRAKTRCGFAAVLNVWDWTLEDKMESFLLSETFKYLYLTFTPPRWKLDAVTPTPFDRSPLVSMEQDVFNTEAHPVPVSSGMHKTYRECTRDGKKTVLPQMSRVMLEDDWTAVPKHSFESWFPPTPPLTRETASSRKSASQSTGEQTEATMSNEDGGQAEQDATLPKQSSSSSNSNSNSLADLFEDLSQPFSLNPDMLEPHQRRQCPPLYTYMRDVAPHIDRLRDRVLCHQLVDTAVLANKYHFYGVPREIPQPRPVEITMPDGTKARISPAALQQMQDAIGAAAGAAGAGTAGVPPSQQQHQQQPQSQNQATEVVTIEVPADGLNPLSNPLRLQLAVPQRLRFAADSILKGSNGNGNNAVRGVVTVPSFASPHMLYIASSETVATFRFPHNNDVRAGFLTGRAVFAPSLCYPRRADRRAAAGPLVILTENRLCDVQAEDLAKRQIESQIIGPSASEAQRATLWANMSFGIMVRRGDCTFKEKIQRAQRVGASYVIVYNDRADSDGILEMADAPSPLKDLVVAVPAVFISRKDAESLINYKTSQEVELEAKRQKEAKMNKKEQKQQGDGDDDKEDADDAAPIVPTRPLQIMGELRCAANMTDQFALIGIAAVESPKTHNVLLAPLRLRRVAEMLRDKASREAGDLTTTVEPGAKCDKPDCVFLLSYLMDEAGVPPWRVVKAAVNRAVSHKHVFSAFAFQVGEPPRQQQQEAEEEADRDSSSNGKKSAAARPAHYGVNGLLARVSDTVTVLSALGLSRSLTYVLKKPWVFSSNALAGNTQDSKHSRRIISDDDVFVAASRQGSKDDEEDNKRNPPAQPQLLRIEIVKLPGTLKSMYDEFDASESAIHHYLRSTSVKEHGVAMRLAGEDPDQPGRMVIATGFVSDAAADAAQVVPSLSAEFGDFAVQLLRQRMLVKSEVVMDMRQRVGVFENF